MTFKGTTADISSHDTFKSVTHRIANLRFTQCLHKPLIWSLSSPSYSIATFDFACFNNLPHLETVFLSE